MNLVVLFIRKLNPFIISQRYKRLDSISKLFELHPKNNNNNNNKAFSYKNGLCILLKKINLYQMLMLSGICQCLHNVICVIQIEHQVKYKILMLYTLSMEAEQ